MNTTDNNLLDKRTSGDYEVIHGLNIQSKENGRFICSCGLNSNREGTQEENKANAAYIVHACNNYPQLKEDSDRLYIEYKETVEQNKELLEALKAVHSMDTWQKYFGGGAIDKQIKAAIEKATSH